MPLSTSSPPSPLLLRLSLGLVYFNFGFLKFFPDLSPAEMLASQTIIRLTGGRRRCANGVVVAGSTECTIGLGFLFNVWLRFVSVLFLAHMIGTFMPMFVLPELAFKMAPLAPTLEGQYILKNIVFVAAGWTVLLPHCLGSQCGKAQEATPIPSSSVQAKRLAACRKRGLTFPPKVNPLTSTCYCPNNVLLR